MPRVDASDDAVRALARDLVAYRERVRALRDTANGDAERVRSFLQDLTRTRRRAHTDALSERSRRTAGSSDGREIEHRIRISAQRLDHARGVAARIEDELRDVEGAIRAHEHAVSAEVESALAALAALDEHLRSYLRGLTASARSGGGRGVGAAAGSGDGTAGLPAGFAIVPIGLIDDADSTVHGAGDFHKTSMRDLEWAHSALLEVVLPTLRAGGDIETLRARDHAEGRVGARSYSDTCAGFLGDSAITLDVDGGTFAVTNGYHRIWLARQMGLDSVVARVRGNGV